MNRLNKKQIVMNNWKYYNHAVISNLPPYCRGYIPNSRWNDMECYF